MSCIHIKSSVENFQFIANGISSFHLKLHIFHANYLHTNGINFKRLQSLLVGSRFMPVMCLWLTLLGRDVAYINSKKGWVHVFIIKLNVSILPTHKLACLSSEDKQKTSQLHLFLIKCGSIPYHMRTDGNSFTLTLHAKTKLIFKFSKVKNVNCYFTRLN